MKIGAMNNPYGNIYKEIEWIGKNGFDFIDFTIEQNTLPERLDIGKAKRLIKRYKLGIVGHIGDWRLPKDSPYPSLREASKTETIKAMRALKKLGAKKITVHSFRVREAEFPEAEKICHDYFKTLLGEARRLKVTLMVENSSHAYTDKMNWRLLTETLKAFPALKLHVDVGHANIGVRKNMTEHYFRRYGRRAIHIHLADNHGKSDEHLKLGAGTVKWKKIIKTLKEYGYDGTMTVETYASGKKGTIVSMKKLRKMWETC
jgi:sugar phosphate isomerase/epimerase